MSKSGILNYNYNFLETKSVGLCYMETRISSNSVLISYSAGYDNNAFVRMPRDYSSISFNFNSDLQFIYYGRFGIIKTQSNTPATISEIYCLWITLPINSV